MANGYDHEQSTVWKPLAIGLMTALVVFMTTTWMMWPKDVATRLDVQLLSAEVSKSRTDLQQLTIQVATLDERVRILQIRTGDGK